MLDTSEFDALRMANNDDTYVPKLTSRACSSDDKAVVNMIREREMIIRSNHTPRQLAHLNDSDPQARKPFKALGEIPTRQLDLDIIRRQQDRLAHLMDRMVVVPDWPQRHEDGSVMRRQAGPAPCTNLSYLP